MNHFEISQIHLDSVNKKVRQVIQNLELANWQTNSNLTIFTYYFPLIYTIT
jgi:hypothetical protein